MIKTKFGKFSQDAYSTNTRRLLNKCYKLLPLREEKGEWAKEIDILLVELKGDIALFQDNSLFIRLLAILLGMKELTEEDQFMLFRKSVFDCLALLGEIREPKEATK